MFGYLAIHMPTLIQLSGILELSAIRWGMCTTVSICKISRGISLLNYDTIHYWLGISMRYKSL